LQVVAYESKILGMQFEGFLRAVQTDSYIHTDKHDDVVLIRIDPLEVDYRDNRHLYRYPADALDWFG